MDKIDAPDTPMVPPVANAQSGYSDSLQPLLDGIVAQMEGRQGFM